MDKTYSYQIITNVNGRHILIINKLIDIDREPSLHDEDFDAIYINISHRSYEENRLIVRWTSPIRVVKCYLKPRFATSSLHDFMHFASNLMDGYCSTPYDKSFTDFIEQTYSNIEKNNIRRVLTDASTTSARFYSSLIKYEITRGRISFTNSTIRGLARGYSELYLSWYDNQETLQVEERTKFNLKMEELGYAEKSHFVERIHTCPKCGHSHLLFIESCPQCQSSDIHQESIIHHFRCANVSPESTYNYDGQLRCPKCKQFLHHIGVDYDRPAMVYTCNTCGNTFLQSKMKVICSNCGETSTPEALNPVDVWEYKLTRAGIEAFATDEALLQIESKDIYSGYSSYADFTRAIQSFNDMSSYRGQVLIVCRYAYNYNGEQGSYRLFDVIRSLLSKMVTVKVSDHNNEIYVLILAHEDHVEKEYNQASSVIEQIFTEYALTMKGFSAHLINNYVFEQGDNEDEFLRRLELKESDPTNQGNAILNDHE